MNQFKVISTTAVPIAVVGQSLTVYAVAAALSQLGYACTLIHNPKTLQFAGPSLVLNDVGQTLLRELFGELNFEQLAQRLTYRWVRWGQETDSEQVYQPAWVIPYSVLLNQILQSEIMQSVSIADSRQMTLQQLSNDYAWTVYGSQQQAALTMAETLDIFPGGQRVMITAEIPHESLTLRDSCYIESLPNGWLFYAPLDGDSGILQACLPKLPINPRRALLDCLYYSQLISPLVNHLDQVRCFPAAPCLQLPLYGSRWLMVGNPAVKLDPISGEGTPFALRTGILAAAVIDGILQNSTTADALLNHYQTRLTHSFLSHLQGCSKYYQPVLGNHELWQGEINQMINTGQNLSSRLKQQTNLNLNYQLIGLKLQELAPN
ncbi:MAG: hypothetical protein QNJ55_07305 [Xenococcus sp. MO_188.B8]|nr:hypothetical protein [Xenococcus sp. MO_188.B8]